LKEILKRNKVMLRAMLVTLMLLGSASVVLVAMGRVYTVVEHNLYGQKVVFFDVGPDSITLFGKDLYFPVFIPLQRFFEAVNLYSSGITKLLKIAVDVFEELILRVIQLL
jgi:hypothetical protein